MAHKSVYPIDFKKFVNKKRVRVAHLDAPV